MNHAEELYKEMAECVEEAIKAFKRVSRYEAVVRDVIAERRR